MKSILYVGATLMIGASIYGFVDYKKTSHNKEFTTMYEEKEVAEPTEVIVSEKNEVVVKKESNNAEKKVVAKKQVADKEVTDVPIQTVTEEKIILPADPVTENEIIAIAETKEIKNPGVDNKATKNSNVEKKVKKKKKFSTKLFSRGGLDDRYIEPKEKMAVPKVEDKKTENKEQ